MILLILALFAADQTQVQIMWDLRAGHETSSIPAIMGSSLYLMANMHSTDLSAGSLLEGITGGDQSLVVPLTALMVSEGRPLLGEIYWELEGNELPATRKDLLHALAWLGRYQLYPAMALNPPVPPDMEEILHSDQCGAVCALGWMTTREDGLFHQDELVSPLDIQILSLYFPEIDASMSYMPLSQMNHLFTSSAGAFNEF